MMVDSVADWKFNGLSKLLIELCPKFSKMSLEWQGKNDEKKFPVDLNAFFCHFVLDMITLYVFICPVLTWQCLTFVLAKKNKNK